MPIHSHSPFVEYALPNPPYQYVSGILFFGFDITTNIAMLLSETLPSSLASHTSEEIQTNRVRNLVDLPHEQYHAEWSSTLLMDPDDYT